MILKKNGKGGDNRLWPASAWPALVVLALALPVLVHHLFEFAAVLREGVGQAQLTIDFRTYMCGASSLTEPYSHCHNGEAVSGFVYPPPSISYFHLLSRLPIDTAFVIHSLIAALSLAAAAWMVLDLTCTSRLARWAGTCAALAIAPIGTSFAAGQVNVIVMACAVAAVWFAGRSRPVAAGLAIATGFWLKLYPIVVPSLFLTRRKFPAAVASGTAVLALGAIGLLWAAPALYLQYFVQLVPHLQDYTMPGVAASIAGIATHIESGGGAPIQHFVPVPAGIRLVSKVVLIIGVVLAMAYQRRTEDRRPLDSLNLLLVAALITAPNAWIYHYALLFPLMLVMLLRGLERPSLLLIPILGCWLALVIPGWTDLPGGLADLPALNVLFRGRYAFAALLLAACMVIDSKAAQRASYGP